MNKITIITTTIETEFILIQVKREAKAVCYVTYGECVECAFEAI